MCIHPQDSKTKLKSGKTETIQKHKLFQRNLLVALPWWRFLSAVITHTWPHVLKGTRPSIVQGGPLGKNCAKLCDVLAGSLLWVAASFGSRTRQDSRDYYWPVYFNFGPPQPSLTMWLAVFVLSFVVNVVLQTWSRLTQSKGSHDGVNAMVKGSLGRSLTVREHARLLTLAALNAFCEEMSSRVLWRSMFCLALGNKCRHDVTNIAQAICFGIWHYNGIPSGITGVVLTFVYGWIMGWLADYSNLWLPLVAHTVADYYIFAILVRRSVIKKEE